MLKKGRSEWPKSLVLDESDDVSQERKKVNVFATVVEGPQDISQVIDANRFSTLGNLLRVAVLVLRFIRNLKSKKEGKS